MKIYIKVFFFEKYNFLIIYHVLKNSFQNNYFINKERQFIKYYILLNTERLI